MPRKVLCSIGAGAHEELLDLSGRTFRHFAALHGYDVVLSTQLGAPDRPPAWSKLPLVNSLLNDYDIVFWVDADAIILQFDKDPAELLPDDGYLALVAHETAEGREIPNLGVFVCRPARTMRQLLASAWSATHLLHHKWWENAAVIELMGYTTEPPVELRHATRFRRELTLLPSEWNTLPLLGQLPGRIEHFAGVGNERRFVQMSNRIKSIGLL